MEHLCAAANRLMSCIVFSLTQRRGPQRSVDTIVSFSFLLVMGLVGAISLKSTTGTVLWRVPLSTHLCVRLALWSLVRRCVYRFSIDIESDPLASCRKRRPAANAL